ncbi:hypothetical protein TBLA_0B03480 [Henningerozyma blattae CBS 6284]|uniref:Tetrapyrrole biosynthesis uroporphyrinogen III synthase domain-containing protein n=1 Tax=Henningerozyma blattae (strain ATCC 34711 / CBS 6284 / DSM 70876 / NBRC 10599 / NRRL Y-10934 / UCD 77-7) TaxID=1071380 RepID=I2GYI7_HENB6|nr:hypothetical protein TBLA_0B03480 [Tetrapisispora blattae CBS 6284]CCH59189.1 hypothetical protein TBLA_0B03480 [Tetrapisispora blattae CBS 6284]
MNGNVILLKNPRESNSKDDDYYKIFDKYGYYPNFLPVITHTNIINQIVPVLNDSDYLDELPFIIVTSQRALTFLNEKDLNNQYPSQNFEKLLNKPVYTVGPATAKCLRNLKFKDIRGTETGNAEALAKLIISELDQYDLTQKPLFLTGEKHKDTITKALKTKFNISVEEIVTYKTISLDDSLLRFKSVFKPNSWIILFSPQGTKDILKYLNDHKLNSSPFHLAAIGPYTREYLISNDLKPDVVSPHPDPISLVNSILTF